jgi:hypothetical protein
VRCPRQAVLLLAAFGIAIGLVVPAQQIAAAPSPSSLTVDG